MVGVILPKHKCSCAITHNEHLDYYETVEQHFNSPSYPQFDITEWISKEDFDLACSTNELWSMQWYPDTPIGSFKIYASSFKVLMEHMISIGHQLEEYH